MSQRVERRKQFFQSFEAKSLRSRSLLTRISDDLTAICGSTPFILAHVSIFAAWVIINTGSIAQIPPFDPFPFGLLTMIVSLEAIFLSIFVLVSQNRSSHINTIRDEFQMRVNLIAEEEITKVLKLLAEIRKEMGIQKADPELDQMIKRIDTNHIERAVIEQLERAKEPWVKQLVKEFPDILTYPVRKPIEIVEKITNDYEKSEKKNNG